MKKYKNYKGQAGQLGTRIYKGTHVSLNYQLTVGHKGQITVRYIK